MQPKTVKQWLAAGIAAFQASTYYPLSLPSIDLRFRGRCGTMAATKHSPVCVDSGEFVEGRLELSLANLWPRTRLQLLIAVFRLFSDLLEKINTLNFKGRLYSHGLKQLISVQPLSQLCQLNFLSDA
ncbi:hypothetical protein [Arthrobacter psychrochitiniphilus]|uniref:Uncharacterized protein n=1 Tax=Arthrobacter psychrochitiniphilus TaxID=291045 RepID=A0A2V3DY55_9MICC|nr:hypothetical protein [Arthrobacter psychrochitiniphilus]PXA65537.1 hypothetical protein CVS29_09870 [Arthrobacter psychrochitiniphilus]